MKSSWLQFAQKPVPRYTSYPTAVDFTDDVNDDTVSNWVASVAADQPISVYAHIPFCNQLCWYCGCATSIPNGYDRVGAYMDVLYREIDISAAMVSQNQGVSHLHLGGGSPNALTPKDFVRLVKTLDQAFGFRPDAEIAVELDPRNLTSEYFDALAEAGVNRVSLGVQTLSPTIQKAINRIQPEEMIRTCMDELTARGITAVNMDLMYGLPDQTIDDVEYAARFAAETGAARIALFGYAHVPWFAKHQKAIQETSLPDLEARFAQAEAGGRMFESFGYAAIGLDHFARPGDALIEAAASGTLHRNFQGYTTDTCPTLIGLGQTSISQFRQGYAQNHKDVRHWRSAIDAGRLPVQRGYTLTTDDRLRAYAIERLMCDMMVNVHDICTQMKVPTSYLDDALAHARYLGSFDICEVDGPVIRVPRTARSFLRTVAQSFDAHHAAGQKRHSNAV